jgi:2-polyprenyl-6-methoxyphenol hydroxylase-like FAD-dependent oxidoreductase
VLLVTTEAELPSDVDVVIIGAGPAGSTLATLLGKYRPQTRVVVLERGAVDHPSVGESLIVDLNRILHEMGATDAMENAGFSRKYGATFLWGDDRTPSNYPWLEDGAQLDLIADAKSAPFRDCARPSTARPRT